MIITALTLSFFFRPGFCPFIILIFQVLNDILNRMKYTREASLISIPVTITDRPPPRDSILYIARKTLGRRSEKWFCGNCDNFLIEFGKEKGTEKIVYILCNRCGAYISGVRITNSYTAGKYQAWNNQNPGRYI